MNKKENQKLSDIVTDKDIIKEAAVLGAKDQTKTRLNTILTDPDNYLRGNLEDYIKEL